MPICYLITWRLPEVSEAERNMLWPVGVMLDKSGRDLIDALPHIEVVARRSYHKIQSQMNDPSMMEHEFHKFVMANKVEQAHYGSRLIGFFPILSQHRMVGKSHSEDRIANVEAYLVFHVDESHELP